MRKIFECVYAVGIVAMTAIMLVSFIFFDDYMIRKVMFVEFGFICISMAGFAVESYLDKARQKTEKICKLIRRH